MSALDLAVIHVARATLECMTPLSIGTGAADGIFDTALVRDANGLPAIPGTAIAGVLRHLFTAYHGAERAMQLFGHQHRDQGSASRVEVSWGCMQDSHGVPVEGILLGAQAGRLESDPLLAYAAQTEEAPLHRDRVRLDHKGTAVEAGKFDRSILPAGYRFGVEIALWGAARDDGDWRDLLALLSSPAFRLGGGTRAGLGAMTLASPLHARSFDLRDAADRHAYAALPPSVGAVAGLSPTSADGAQTSGGPARSESLELSLEPRDFWRFGAGDKPLLRDDDPADALPRLEPRVLWNAGKGGLGEPALLIPGVAVKGALAHRVAFHHNRENRVFAEDLGERGALRSYDKSEACPAVREIFGHVKGSAAPGDEDAAAAAERAAAPGDGRAGRCLIDDIYVELPPANGMREAIGKMRHNSIDRFSGGVREHLLFSEELAWKSATPIRIRLTLLEPDRIAPSSRRALELALRDLCQGRLALGAGAGRGHGYFSGLLNAQRGANWPDVPKERR